ncbi:short-chain dehydrogenase/reductase SDR [Meredithblackwellia eburnea MCA 4105]
MASPSPKVAVVTGSSSGIGRSSAIALSKAGWAVVLSGRRKIELEETAASCTGSAGVLIVVGDITKEADVLALFTEGFQNFGKIDLLFNNAGVDAPDCLLEDIELAQWQQVVNVNLTGAFLCTREAIRYMKKTGGGKIISNGSISAHTPRPNSSPYTATKHAILGLTKSTALDGRKYDISCTQIDIGNAATELGGAVGAGSLQANGTVMAEPKMHVENVGDAIVYIAGLPKGVNILSMTIMATNMPFVGRG